MSEFRTYLSLISLALVFSGCSLEATISPISSLSPDEVPIYSKTKVGEFVSGSGKYEDTPLRRYRVTSSVGSINKELVTKSPRGYFVYSSAQGAIISEEVQK